MSVHPAVAPIPDSYKIDIAAANSEVVDEGEQGKAGGIGENAVSSPPPTDAANLDATGGEKRGDQTVVTINEAGGDEGLTERKLSQSNYVAEAKTVQENKEHLDLINLGVKRIMNKPRKKGPAPPHVHEEAYLPVSYAREKIEAMAQDMVRLKEAYRGKVFQLDHFYRQLETETQAHYAKFIGELREKAVQRIAHYKHLLRDETKAANEYKEKTLLEISSLKENTSLLEQAKATLAENAAKEASDLRRHEEAQLKLAAEHEQKVMQEAKTHEHDLLLTDAQRLANTQKAMRGIKEQLQADFETLTKEYKVQMVELRKHVIAFQTTHSKEMEELQDAHRSGLEGVASKHAAALADQESKSAAEHAANVEALKSAHSAALTAASEEAAKSAPHSASPSKSAPLLDAGATRQSLQADVEAARAKKKESKAKAKGWMTEFQAREGRPPSHDDKAKVSELFLEAKRDSSHLKALEEKLGSMSDAPVLQKSSSAPPPSEANGASAAEIKALHLEVSRLQDENSRLKQASEESLKAAKQAASEAAADNVREREEASKALKSGNTEALAKQLEEFMSKNKDMEQSLASMKLAFDIATDERKTLVTMVDSKAEEISSLRSELERAKDPAVLASLAKSSAPTDRSKDIADYKSQIEDLEDENEKLQEKLDEARKAPSTTGDDDDGESARATQLEASLSKVKDELEAAVAEIELLKEEAQETAGSPSNENLAKEKEALEQALATAKAGSADPDATDSEIAKAIDASVKKGKAMWHSKNRQGCYDEYLRAIVELSGNIPASSKFKKAFESAGKVAKSKSAGEGAVMLRKQFKAYTEQHKKNTAEGKADQASSAGGGGSDKGKVAELEKQLERLKASASAPTVASSSSTDKRAKLELKKMEIRAKNAEKKVADLEKSLAAAKKHSKLEARQSSRNMGGSRDEDVAKIKELELEVKALKKRGGSGGGNANDQKKLKELQQKLKKVEKEAKDGKVKLKQMEGKLEKAEQKAASSSGNDQAKQVMERKMKEVEKKHKKESEKAKQESDKKISILERNEKKLKKAHEELEASVAEMKKERDALKKKVGAMGAMGKEMETLKAQAAECEDAKKAAAAALKRQGELQTLYKEESVLRKRYWNMMEDMKGKIRVYCRVRPLSKSEIERGNHICVDFPDEVTINVEGEKGTKQFVFDQCFTPSSTQEEVFEDCSSLVNSAFDGFNVCVFAYGQTGAGKSFTMLGALPELKGITPRAIDRIFQLKGDLGKKATIKCKAYMAELYNDTLVDLLYTAKHKKEKGMHKQPPKLDIKKDAKGMVFVKGIEIVEVNTPEEMMDLFNTGNGARHVGATKMNAVSSRSHLIFSIIIENHDHTSGKTNVGKLTLVDLAGSERVGKTGATKERLREAQSINQSLSALGDVISSLSTGAKFIPYRNNKLTMLLADGLGGNAKTLMFVNASPADYNAAETQTALVYASRVKMITNAAKKESDSEIVAHLKKIVDEFVTVGKSTTFESKGLDPSAQKADA